MLRINLLPAYVAQRRITRTLVAIYSVATIAVLIVMGVWYVGLYNLDATETTMATTAEANKAEVDAITAQATSATAALAPIQANLDFVNHVKSYNLSYIELFKKVADYTSPKILYNSMDLNGTNLAISGYTPSMADLGRYLLEMYKEPDATSVALTSEIPGYGAANPDAPETFTVPAGISGKLPGYPGPVYSYTVYRGKIVSINSGGAGAANQGFGGGIPGMAGRGGFGGMPGGFNPMAQAGQAGTVGRALFDPRKDGFPFTVVLALKSVQAPPAPPVTPTVVTVGGAGGFRGGLPGGFRGGPPGGFPGGLPMGPPGGMGGAPFAGGGPPPGFTPPTEGRP